MPTNKITLSQKELKKLIQKAVKAQSKKDADPKPFICMVPKYAYKPLHFIDFNNLPTPSNS